VEDDEDIRLERYRGSAAEELHEQLGEGQGNRAFRRDMTLFIESPNGYEVTGDAPPDDQAAEATKHYSAKLRQFTVRYPAEWALCHFCLGRVFHMDRSGRGRDGRGKAIENALFHLDKAMQFYTYDSYPCMWAVSCLMIGQLYRERVTLTVIRSLLKGRGSTSDALRKGLDNTREAATVLSQSKRLAAELAICGIESGWLYLLLQEEEKKLSEKRLLLDQAITHLERGLAGVNRLNADFEATEGQRVRPFNPQDPRNYPAHVRALVGPYPFRIVEGLCMYLLGRCYAGLSELKDHQETGFDYFTRCVKPNFIPQQSMYWVDAHVRVSALILKSPYLVDPEFEEHKVPVIDDDTGEVSMVTPKAKGDTFVDRGVAGSGNAVGPQVEERASSTQIALDAAIQHLQVSMHSSAAKPRLADIQFKIACANLERLHLLLDNIPPGMSLVEAMSSKGGYDVMEQVEHHLLSGLERLTAAGQNTQEAYIFYFSCLKLSELKMMQTVSMRGLMPEDKIWLLSRSVDFLNDALDSRSLWHNLDLHYIAMVQMCNMLLATRRVSAALKVWVKILLTLSATICRAKYTPGQAVDVYAHEVSKQISLALHNSQRLSKWIQRHPKPFLSAPLKTYDCVWGFEEVEDEPDPNSGSPLGKHASVTNGITATDAALRQASTGPGSSVHDPDQGQQQQQQQGSQFAFFSEGSEQGSQQTQSSAYMSIESALTQGQIGGKPPAIMKVGRPYDSHLHAPKTPVLSHVAAHVRNDAGFSMQINPQMPIIPESEAAPIPLEMQHNAGARIKFAPTTEAADVAGVPFHRLPALGISYSFVKAEAALTAHGYEEEVSQVHGVFKVL
jgi:hypothetical protein